MKRLFLAIAALMSISLSAQNVTLDTDWCNAIEQVLADYGVHARVTSDITNGKTLHVNADGATRRYSLVSQFDRPDYSSPICIVADPLEFRFPHNNVDRSSRAWLGPRSLSYVPEEVFFQPADIESLELAIRRAVGSTPRISLIDSNYGSTAGNNGALTYVLRGTIVTAQRGESYAKPAPPKEGEKAPAKPQPNARKVERRFAYARVNLELIDYFTGVVVWNSDFAYDDNSSFSSSNPMENVVSHIARAVSQSLEKRFPSVAPRAAVAGHVLRAATVKKNKAETVFIDLGAAHELRKGDLLTVYLSTEVDAHAGATQIGTLTVSEVQGATLTLCKVKKGEKEIFEAISAGNALIVEGNLD